MPRAKPAFLGLLALLAIPAAGLAYGTLVHDIMPHAMLAARRTPDGRTVGTDVLPGVSDADLARFRGWLYQQAAHLADTSLRAAFLRRYPRPNDFTPRAFKEFLMMDGTASVLGVDSFATVQRGLGADQGQDPHPPYVSGAPLPVELGLAIGNDFVDLDRRNQNRLLRDQRGEPIYTTTGDTIPFDPMTLNMGHLTGLSSQAHAHYGFNHDPKSTDPAVLKTRPWDFAVPLAFGDTVRTYAEDNAQLYSDLSDLAWLEGGHGSGALSVLYAGNAFHYIEDVGNAIHTLQVGLYSFFVDATLYHAWRRLVTLFGLLGPTPSRNSIGVDIVSNHHLLSEALFQSELMTALAQDARGHADSISPSMTDALRALREGDPKFRPVLQAAIQDANAHLSPGEPPPIGAVVAAAVIEDGNRDGAEIYRLTRDMGVMRLRRSPAIDFDTIPADQLWQFISRPGSAATQRRLAEFNEAQARGLGRVHDALNAWWDDYLALTATPRARRAALTERLVDRLVRARLIYLVAAERRRQAWIAQHGGVAP